MGSRSRGEEHSNRGMQREIERKKNREKEKRERTLRSGSPTEAPRGEVRNSKR